MRWWFHNKWHTKSNRPAASVATEGLDLLRNPTPTRISEKHWFRKHGFRSIVVFTVVGLLSSIILPLLPTADTAHALGISVSDVTAACKAAGGYWYNSGDTSTQNDLNGDGLITQDENLSGSGYYRCVLVSISQTKCQAFASGVPQSSTPGDDNTTYMFIDQMPIGADSKYFAICELNFGETVMSKLGNNTTDDTKVVAIAQALNSSANGGTGTQTALDGYGLAIVDRICKQFSDNDPPNAPSQNTIDCSNAAKPIIHDCMGTLINGQDLSGEFSQCVYSHLPANLQAGVTRQNIRDAGTAYNNQTKIQSNKEIEQQATTNGKTCDNHSGDYTQTPTCSCPTGTTESSIGTCLAPEQSSSSNSPVCSVGGLDFLLCPLVNLLTGLNDAFFSSVVSGVLDTSPMLGNNADDIKSAYDKILPIANIVLVIIFLIIVYSTAVGNGSGALSNYNVKKMLPRLIVAAIAMNTAWYICAAAVDISNILGRGLYELIASSAPSIEEGFGWKAMLSTTIAGGVAVAGVGIAAVLMSPEVLILMLLVAALGGFIAFIAGWFTMLLRNVVVTLCVIIAPVAIVAFVLPNTKKWADKWRNIFFTMLAMYPIIAVFTAGALFAGSAMAGSDSMFTKFGGLIVMAAPMFMLPFMVKKTSGVLGTIQDKMTNLGKSVTSKPLGDWVNRNKEGMRDRFQAGDTRLSKMPGFRALSNVGSNLAGRRRTRELRGKNAGTALENEWLNEGTRETKKGHTVFNLNTAAGRAQARMARLANANTAATGAINAATSRMNSKDLKVNARINKNEIRDEVSKGIIEGEKQAQRAGKSVKPKYDLSAEQTESTIRQQAIQTAKGIQAGNYARAVNEKSGDKYTPAAEYLAKIAGMGDARYMSRVRAGAQGIVSKEDQEAATAAAQLFLHDHPQATTADVGQAMEDAVALGEDGTDLARGLSEHLATGMGGAGINQLETSMNTMEAKWVSNPSTLTVDELNRYNAFRANLTGKVPKNKSASLDSASIAPFATVDPGTGKVTIKKTLTQIQGTKETYTRLTTGEKSTLSPDELHRAITADAISYDEAQALLNDSRYSQNLTNDTIKLVNGQNVRERLAAIPAPPTPPTP